jgi:hypothetical protein
VLENAGINPDDRLQAARELPVSDVLARPGLVEVDDNKIVYKYS